MTAFLNALREEGTKEDFLATIERLWDQLTAARLAGRIDGLESAARICEEWEKERKAGARNETVEEDAEAMFAQAQGAWFVGKRIRAKIAELQANS